MCLLRLHPTARLLSILALSSGLAFWGLAGQRGVAIGGRETRGAKLLFKSGFEADVTLLPPSDIVVTSACQELQGLDQQSGFTWPPVVLGSSDSALHLVDHANLQALDNQIQTIVGPQGVPTRVLYNAHYFTPAGKATQSPYEIRNITEGTSDLYIRYWIMISSDYLDVVGARSSWRTFFEWKSKDYASGAGFRLISYIYTDNNGTPYWHWQGDANPQAAIWEIDNFDVPVPIGEWFLTEFYWHWSEGQDGRALWRVNGQVVGDYHGPSTRNSKPIDFILMTQIYGDITPKFQWIDDIEIWDGLPPQYVAPR